jgi:hypothetical protein
VGITTLSLALRIFRNIRWARRGERGWGRTVVLDNALMRRYRGIEALVTGTVLYAKR